MSAISKLFEEVVNENIIRVKWPRQDEYRNSRTGRVFKPQNETVAKHVFEQDTPRHLYFMSGEGAGKTATLSVLVLEKLRRGMSGAFVCVDLPMLRKVWDEFKLWIPWDCVIPQHRYMASAAWSPYQLFKIVFMSEMGMTAELTIGGLGDNISKWESLNINFLAGDEFRSVPKDDIMKVALGRMRVRGPNGEPPQLIIGSTPTYDDHWMYDYFGPITGNDDPLLGFKKESEIIKLFVADNADNLDFDYVNGARALTLTEEEKRVYIDGEWGNSEGDMRFLESMTMWTKLYDPMLMPPRRKGDPGRNWADTLVVAMDGAIKRDSFALVAVSRHPNNRNDVAVRLVHEFKPINGKIDFRTVEDVLRSWCDNYNIVTIVYDVYQLYDMTERLRKEGIAWFQEFSQQRQRTLSDNLLYELIVQERIRHSNQAELTDHINNAGHRYDSAEMKRRIVKIRESRKIDLVIATGMAAWECLRLNL